MKKGRGEVGSDESCMYRARHFSIADAWRVRDPLPSAGKERRGAIADCFAVRATESVSNGAKSTVKQMSIWKRCGYVALVAGSVPV